MALSNSDRITSTGLNRVISALWTKIKSTFAFDNAVVHNSGDENIEGIKTFQNNPKVKNRLTSQASTIAVYKSVGTDNEKIEMRFNTNGYRGIYDGYNNDWIVYCDTANVPVLNGTANRATADGDGNNIVSTYVTNTALSSALALKQNASNALTTNTDQNIWGVKTFKTMPLFKANRGASSVRVEKTDSTDYTSFSYWADGSRGIYDSKIGSILNISSSNDVTLRGTALNSTKWNGKELVIGPMPEASAMSSNKFYISE